MNSLVQQRVLWCQPQVRCCASHQQHRHERRQPSPFRDLSTLLVPSHLVGVQTQQQPPLLARTKVPSSWSLGQNGGNEGVRPISFPGNAPDSNRKGSQRGEKSRITSSCSLLWARLPPRGWAYWVESPCTEAGLLQACGWPGSLLPTSL